MYNEHKVIAMKLLIAEDEPDLAEALQSFFEKNQFTVDTVSNDADAYAYAQSGGYDALILDVDDAQTQWPCRRAAAAGPGLCRPHHAADRPGRKEFFPTYTPPEKTDWTLFAPCAAQTLRGFGDDPCKATPAFCCGGFAFWGGFGYNK